MLVRSKVISSRYVEVSKRGSIMEENLKDARALI